MLDSFTEIPNSTYSTQTTVPDSKLVEKVDRAAEIAVKDFNSSEMGGRHVVQPQRKSNAGRKPSSVRVKQLAFNVDPTLLQRIERADQYRREKERGALMPNLAQTIRALVLDGLDRIEREMNAQPHLPLMEAASDKR